MSHITWTEMGLGKTYTGSEQMMKYGNKVNLIVCQKSKIQDWVEHFKQNYEFVVADLTKKNGFDLLNYTIRNNDYIVGIVNYELAWRRPELLNLKDFTLMLDESSLIQNSKAKQTKFILKMKPKNVILLSGSPTSGKYENLWSQAHLLRWNISERQYNNEFVNWETKDFGTGFPIKVVNKRNPYKNVDRLKEKFRQHGAVFMKTEDVIELPEQNFIPVRVDKSSDYKKFDKNKLLEIDGEELIGDTVLTERLYKRLLCGAYSKEKQTALKDLIESTQDRLIVFYNYNRELEVLKGVCKALNRPYSEVNGSVKDLSAYEEESNSVTFVQYQAGAMGLNLQKANKIIYFSPTDKCELWMQSQKRIHRIGQERPCFYYKMIVKGSIETQIYKALEKGVDFVDYLFLESN